MQTFDIEKNNRKNFKSMLDALSMPGTVHKLEPTFESSLLAVASVLLYSETSYFYEGDEDFSLIEAISNTSLQICEKADYIFSDTLNADLLQQAKKGDFINPDFSATLIFRCEDFHKHTYSLSGPGIDKNREVNLPVNQSFIDTLQKNNSNYPKGLEVFFINDINEVTALSRTTKIMEAL